MTEAFPLLHSNETNQTASSMTTPSGPYRDLDSASSTSSDVTRNARLLVAAKLVYFGLFVFMVYTVIYTCLESNLIKEWNALAKIPWMTATLKDFYVNVFAIYCWVFYKESRWYLRAMWLVYLVCLGSIATCGYVLIELFKLKPGQPLHLVFLKRSQVVT
mmetsp:Transcript_19478/g.33450  ORF Transcript_19478/g.33450 Transcript_19478/m.33450 type:complete len:160 (-) Transcript_19478:389-868(-)